jgi:hypothetical protein
MSLEKLTVPELRETYRKLKEQIQRNPGHSAMEKEELHDVEQWIRLRQTESIVSTEKT